MMQAVMVEGVNQGAHDVSLPDQLGKAARPPFTRKYLVTHLIELNIVVIVWVAAPISHTQHPPGLLRLLPSGPDRVHNLAPLRGLIFTAIKGEFKPAGNKIKIDS